MRLTDEQVARLRDIIHADCGERVRPHVGNNGVPGCDQDTPCPSFDGKRCRQTGFRAGYVCEPATEMLITRLVR